jgi:hypothetical protein
MLFAKGVDSGWLVVLAGRTRGGALEPRHGGTPGEVREDESIRAGRGRVVIVGDGTTWTQRAGTGTVVAVLCGGWALASGR